MPDRVQSGSAGLRNGRNIELIQNRRIDGWDGYGVLDVLNDRDAQNRSLVVQANYFMEISQIKGAAAPSHQRAQQKSMEQPVLVYYSKDFHLTGPPPPEKVHPTPVQIGAKQDIASVKTVKTFIYALGRGEILIRINNLEDRFDANP